MRRIHFDLRHIASTDGLEIRVQGKRYPLHPHGEETLAAAAAEDAAFLALPPQVRVCFGYFTDIAAEHVTGDTPVHVHLVEPEQEGVHLPKVVAMTILFPESHLRKFWERQLALYAQPLHRIRSLHRHTVRRQVRTSGRHLPRRRPCAGGGNPRQ